MGDRQDTKGTPGGRKGRPNRYLVAGLAIYAVAAPLAISAIGALRPEPPLTPAIGTAALAVALLGPGLAALAVAGLGLGAIARRMQATHHVEVPRLVARLGTTGVALACLGGLALRGDAEGTLLPMLAVAIPGILCAWLTLVHLMVRPEAAGQRQAAALVADMVLISAFLHFGGRFGAPGFALYLGAILSAGFALGERTLVLATLLALAGFVVVCQSTPFWQADPAMAATGALSLALTAIAALAPIRRLDGAEAVAGHAAIAQRRFLAIIGHELRTPLTSVIGMGGLLERTPLDGAQREMLASLQSSSRGLATLVDDLLDFARLEAGKLAPPVGTFKLRETLGAAVALLRSEAEAKGLALSLDIDPRLPPACRGLEMPLRQVATNLVANAVKFTARGRVAVSATLLERAGDALRLRLQVRDDGMGIPDGVRDRIFDAFTQADETVAQRFGGTGLGLAIAREFTELMGGTISVESQIGRGSTFQVDVPLEEDRSTPGAVPDLGGRLVLVVSADRDFARDLCATLEAWRAAPVWHADGETALTTLANDGPGRRPAVLLLDGRDDPLAGLSLAHRATTGLPWQPPLLFIAASDSGRAIADIAAARFAAIVEAPVSEASLAEALQAMQAADPRNDAEPDAAADPPPVVAVAARARVVLVADDDAANRKILASVLQAAGHEVMLAPDGATALALLDRQPIDLALIDINMPGVSGYEVARHHRARRREDGGPSLVALTADTSSEIERLCREAGMDAVLAKPIDAGHLLRLAEETPERALASAAHRSAVDEPPPRVTPISSHPRFVPEGPAVVDEATMAALRTLGGNDFVADVIASFRGDAWRLLGQLRNAVARGDVRSFRDAVHSLRSGSANVGALRLCQTLTALRDVTVAELRQTGLAYLDKVEADLARLDASLDQLVREQRRV
jgi:two-component system sensor histidine kinase RpfC